MKKLPLSYFRNNDVTGLAKDLIGKKLCTRFDGQLTTGFITETEAYHSDERACHAHLNRRTKRTEIMFDHGGRAYVYLCYGIHHLFNIVTGKKDEAQAILLRAIEPVEGVETMQARRNKEKVDKGLCSGPGTLSQALGITTAQNGLSLTSKEIWLEEGKSIKPEEIKSTARIGVGYAGEDALLPWRFYLKSSAFVSKL